VPFYGAVVACADDPSVHALLRRISRRAITYGFAEGAHVRGYVPISDGRSARCHVRFDVHGVPDGTGAGDLELRVPGRHNLQNALAAVAVGLELGVPFGRIAAALAEFRGAERRYQIRGIARDVTVVDDYGHHPAEIAAALRAARDGAPARLIAVFQPHRYTRTRDLLDDFGPALAIADVVVLTDIYAAGEPPIPGITLEGLADAVRREAPQLHVVPALPDVAPFVAGLAQPGDLILTLGAGSIGTVGERILAELEHGADRGPDTPSPEAAQGPQKTSTDGAPERGGRKEGSRRP
jgi:UDP-N-acetylmuramate--alanine ligase